jgi:cytochrome c oxidase subunit 3/cytochrome o ubiquinol oxidase subunit 3
MAETSSDTVVRLPVPPPIEPELGLTPVQWGVATFLMSEVAFFATLIATYLSFVGKEQSGPTPAVLSLGLVICTTICLLSSSVTVHLAERALRAGARSRFLALWSATIGLGVVFLAGTAYEWNTLISEHGLTISRNVFGSTYYTLVGFHALHVTAGVVILTIVLGLVVRGEVTASHPVAAEMTSWYWHFVDGVWVVVFTVVYVVGR